MAVSLSKPRNQVKRLLRGVAFSALAVTHGAMAQDTGQADKPLSAIDWLSDSLQTPLQVAPNPTQDASDVAQNALPSAVTVQSLEKQSLDAAGLLPSATTGLPKSLWGSSSSADIARRITSLAQRDSLLPSSRRLLNTLVLAELDPPVKSDARGMLYLARVDALLTQGLLDEANALLDLVGQPSADVFRRSFDTKLLLGTENLACARLTRTPGLSPSQQARIFCLAREGKWDDAALTLNTSEALGLLGKEQAELLARFLDPELFEGDPPLVLPLPPSPLTFRVKDAIGEPYSTVNLPLAFAYSDLGTTTGWKARAIAAERLAAVGAISANKWLGVWSEHLPAASGGIWDRIDALQRFETALRSGDPGAISSALPPVWQAMSVAGLQPVFAELFAKKLSGLPLSGAAQDIAIEVQLLAPSYEENATSIDPSTLSKEQVFLIGIALGDVPLGRMSGQVDRAIQSGFQGSGIPTRLSSLVTENRLGEAILRSIELLEGGAAGDLDELTDAIQFFRSVGLEATARRAALEILLLERRG